MRIMKMTVCILVLTGMSACALGPGTPLFAVVSSPTGQSDTVQPPKGYGSPIGNAESQGLINPEDRKETEAYLKSLSER